MAGANKSQSLSNRGQISIEKRPMLTAVELFPVSMLLSSILSPAGSRVFSWAGAASQGDWEASRSALHSAQLESVSLCLSQSGCSGFGSKGGRFTLQRSHSVSCDYHRRTAHIPYCHRRGTRRRHKITSVDDLGAFRMVTERRDAITNITLPVLVKTDCPAHDLLSSLAPSTLALMEGHNWHKNLQSQTWLAIGIGMAVAIHLN